MSLLDRLLTTIQTLAVMNDQCCRYIDNILWTTVCRLEVLYLFIVIQSLLNHRLVNHLLSIGALKSRGY